MSAPLIEDSKIMCKVGYNDDPANASHDYGHLCYPLAGHALLVYVSHPLCAFQHIDPTTAPKISDFHSMLFHESVLPLFTLVQVLSVARASLLSLVTWTLDAVLGG
jgi:hypothetical protein